ncbi:MAG: hypothetical protein J6V09_00780 [Clostridia bacterium]|nr:hypothetical protein [Clostridia bacterium]
MVFLLIASIILSIATISVTAIDDDVYFVNANGIEITFLNYQKLLSVGYTEREIQSISLDEYNQIAQMEILSIEKDDYYIKTVTVENEDGTTTTTDEIITEEQAYAEIEAQEDGQDEYGIAPAVAPPHIEFGEGEGEGGDSNPAAITDRTTEYKHMEVTGVFYRGQGALGTFFVKVTLEWLKTPTMRYTDIMSINFTDNVQITNEYIGGGQYSAFDARFYYDERHYHLYNDSENTPTNAIDETDTFIIEFDGSNLGSYDYKEDQGLGVSFNLPSNHHTDEGLYKDCYKYSDFYMTLSANFIPKQYGINAATFIGTYQHQIFPLSFGWDDISFSLQAPYFSFSLGFIEGNPTFDGTLAAPIFFENLYAG